MIKNQILLRPAMLFACSMFACWQMPTAELSAQTPEKPGPVVRSRVVAAIEPPAETLASGDAEASPERAEKFAKYMSGAKLKGQFTVLGMKDKMPEETYTISKCEKLPEGNLYRFTARIQYGETDTELPMDLPVVWAGDTPVITLTNMWLPGLGTFSSRVLIYKGSYAGTWQHDEVGGHLFGVIEKDEVVGAAELEAKE
jgi:hypothetical protein